MAVKRRTTVGLALGGGGARGLAHVGVIKALLRAGIPIDYIAGTSMGALVGGFYAATGDLELVENVFSKLRPGDIVPVSKLILKRSGALFHDQGITRKLEQQLDGMTFSKCKIPFAAIATDVKNGENVIMREGKLIDAIRASIAIPLIFQPVQRGDLLLMDGGFCNPVPADVVRNMGADYVIAVDVTSQWMNLEDEAVNWKNMYSVVSNSLSVIEYQISREILKKADIVLRPPVTQHGWLDFDHADPIIIAGVDEVNMNLKRICAETGTPTPDETPLEKLIDLIRGY